MSTMPQGTAENSPSSAAEQPQVILGLQSETPEPAPAQPSAEGHPAPTGTGTPQLTTPAPQTASEWSDELRAAFPELTSKFRGPRDALASYASLEQVFHAFRQRGLDPEQVLSLLDGQEAEAGAGAAPGVGEGTDEGTAGPDAAAAVGEIPTEPAAFLDHFAENPHGTVAAIAETVATRVFSAMTTAQRMWTEALQRYPDLAQHEQAMHEVLQAAPGLARYPDVIDRLYRMVAGGTPAKDAIDRARAEARQQAIAEVTGTTLEGGRTGATPPSGASRPEQSVVEDILTAAGSPNTIPGLRPV